MRRDRENQRESERLERATPIWTRSAYFPYGPAAGERPHHEAGHTKAPDHIVWLLRKIPCIPRGASPHETHPIQHLALPFHLPHPRSEVREGVAAALG